MKKKHTKIVIYIIIITVILTVNYPAVVHAASNRNAVKGADVAAKAHSEADETNTENTGDQDAAAETVSQAAQADLSMQPVDEASAFKAEQRGSDYILTVNLNDLFTLQGQNPDGRYVMNTPFMQFTLPYRALIPADLQNYIETAALDYDQMLLKITASALDSSGNARLVRAYQDAYPQGQIIGGPYLISMELCLNDGSPLDFKISTLNEILELTIGTEGRANAVFSYDEDADRLSFMAAEAEASAVTVKTRTLKPLIAVRNDASFSDTANHWAETHILIAARKGLVSGTGYGQFEPNRNITRAEFSRLVAQALEIPSSNTNSELYLDAVLTGYSDVAENAWYYDSIMGLKASGILNAFTGRTFLPDQDISREEMAEILSGAMDYLGVPHEGTFNGSAGRFTDQSSIDSRYLGSVEKIIGLGIMQGMNDMEFQPKGNATRAQAATVLTGMLRRFGFIDSINYDFSDTALYSTGAVLINLNTGEELLSKNQDASVYPASLTKLMTGLVMLENWDKVPDTITLDAAIIDPLEKADSSMAGFEAGEIVTKEDLLYGVMLKSGGECAHTLAQAIAGSEWEFAYLMNAKARELGMTGTNFTNVTGLHDDQHYTTIRDLKTLFLHVLENEELTKIITTRYYTTQPTNLNTEGMTFENGIFERFGGDTFSWGTVLGGKTGYTGQAGQCLASLVEKNGVKYIMITTGNGVRAPGVRYYTADVATVYSQFILK